MSTVYDRANAMTATWGELARAEPELAAFGKDRLAARPCYLATIRADGSPRVHPVTPVVSADGLFVFSEPTSPKVADLRERGSFALHNGVPDNDGTGGEFLVTGRAREVHDEPKTRAAAVAAATYEPRDHYLLFELLLAEARCNGYDDVTLPARTRWTTSG